MVRYYCRLPVLILMRWLGLIRLFQFFRRNQIVILMAHGVMDERDNHSWKPLRPQLSRNKLEEYLRVLSKRYRFISLADAVEMLQGHKPMQPYSMVLTFDDGYRNNLTHALPILRRFNAPATFFVPTGFLDNPKPFWCDRLDYALQQAQVDGREVSIGSFVMRLDGTSREALQESYKRFRRTAKEQQIPDYEFLREVKQFAVQLEAESGRALADIQADDDWSAIMTWEQIKTIGDEAVTIGSHTVDHIRLGLVDAEIARDQLERSKRDIEEHISKPCLSICYPNGSLTDETVSLARECGYICGLTTKEGLNCVGDDVMKLQRIGLPVNARSIDLLARITGVSMAVSRAGQGHRKLYGNLGQWKLNMFHHYKCLKNIFFYHMSYLFKNKKNNIPNVHKYENYDISKYLETAEKLKINIMPLGFGVYELTKGKITRRISSSLYIDKENALTYKLCGNKYLTYKILLNNGIRSVPKHKLYQFHDVNNTINDFVDWNCPVVIKPCSSTSGGTGVTVNIKTVKELKNAIAESFIFDRRAYLMEQYIEGSHFRLLTLRGEFIACSQRTPARIIGNGKDSIKKLIEDENQRRNKDASERTLYPIVVGNEVRRKLRSMNKSMHSVLRKDEEIYITDLTNMHAGGEARNVENVSEDIKSTCKKIAKRLDIYLAGFDIITNDISKNLDETGGVINEVNTSPGMSVIYKVTNYDTHVDAADIVLKDMFNL